MLKQTPSGGCTKICPGFWPSRCKGFVWGKEAECGEDQVSNETRCWQPARCDMWTVEENEAGVRLQTLKAKSSTTLLLFFLSQVKNVSRSLFSRCQAPTHTYTLSHLRADGPGEPWTTPKGKLSPAKPSWWFLHFCGLSQLHSCRSETEFVLSAAPHILLLWITNIPWFTQIQGTQ